LIPVVTPNVRDADLKIPGFEFSVKGDPDKQVPDATTAVVAQIAPLQLSVQKLQDAVSKQEAVNKTITSSLAKLEANAAGNQASIALPDINATSETFATNSQYIVFVFYKTPRAKEAQTLLKALTGAGFQASAIATSFLDVGQLAGDGSTYIQPTEKGLKIQKDVEAIATKLSLLGITLGGPYALKRGDIQVFLY